MRCVLLAALAVLLALAAAKDVRDTIPRCGRPPTTPVVPRNGTLGADASAYKAILPFLPEEWDWRDHANLADHFSQRSALTWCGSCFAAGAAMAVTDRFRIAYKRRFGQRSLSVQALLNCHSPRPGTGNPGNCNGGDWEHLYDLMERQGVTDETCMPYLGLDRSFSPQLPCEDTMCRECTLDGSCRIIPNAPRYYISQWGTVTGAEAMRAELFTNGPLTCYIFSHVPEFSKYTGGIIPNVQITPQNNITHVVEVIGYGSEAGTPFWVARNWAGAHWGEDGYFRIHRGSNSLNMEWNCGWATPSFEPNTPRND